MYVHKMVETEHKIKKNFKTFHTPISPETNALAKLRDLVNARECHNENHLTQYPSLKARLELHHRQCRDALH